MGIWFPFSSLHRSLFWDAIPFLFASSIIQSTNGQPSKDPCYWFCCNWNGDCCRLTFRGFRLDPKPLVVCRLASIVLIGNRIRRRRGVYFIGADFRCSNCKNILQNVTYDVDGTQAYNFDGYADKHISLQSRYLRCVP